MTIGRNYAFKDPREIDLNLVIAISQETLRKKNFEVLFCSCFDMLLALNQQIDWIRSPQSFSQLAVT